MKKWTVRDVMTADVVAVPEDASYRTIVDVLADGRISAVPVVDPTGQVVGVVSEADLLYKVEFAGTAGGQRRIFPSRRRSPREKGAGRTARELMSTPVVTAGVDTSLPAAARLMTEKGVKRLPVVAPDGSLVGIVSRADVLKVHLRRDEELRRDVVDEVLRRTLWLEPFEVRVVVDGGVVTLDGHLDRRTLAELTVQLVGSVLGVVAVRDHLSYDLDDAELARSRWNRSHPFSATGPSA
ncbi:CBS domain-containing protein [Micromonospora sp. WMMD1102]|uniref:CBS domain-containing protein n=1 Tax=Micromonospora sp. WMMD1102 TaxID=3016105 RepID=UPI00241532C1|nr:CBS domain-containing protein [Micromonospora sp. WMMD1102]MDG4786693.1 CBS domain-containing protein [Micromonospora sp. WMMD1102]